MAYRGWEYARKGDYHRKIDPNWSYTPTYLRKIALVKQLANSLPSDAHILDVGSGEGVLVEELRRQGRTIEGIDLNYESESVRRGDVRDLPYSDSCFDAVLCLDTLEHLTYEDQEKALSEIWRILKPGGQFIISVPNLAHLNSRVRFLFRGRLDRTDIATNHVGERPLSEYEQLLKNAGFMILNHVGITFTLPWVYRRIICRQPARFRWLHDLMEPLAKAFSSLAMLAVLVCKKGSAPPSNGRVGFGKRIQVLIQARRVRLFSIPTHLTQRERVLLFEMAKSLPPFPTVVEVGSYLGSSTCCLAAGCRLRKGRVYAVDTWTNSGMSEGPRDTYQEFLRNTTPLRDWIVPLRGYSTEVGSKFSGQIDLLFVDGDHSYEAVRADLETWLPKVKDGGMVLLYGYNWAQDVNRAVRELVVPIQIQGGRLVDRIYVTRIGHHGSMLKRLKLLVSIIIPTYSRPGYLKDAVNSIQAQDFDGEQFEIIVVDNGPAAEAKEVVEEANRNGLHPVRYVREPHVGLHHARHAGAQEAQGEILVYVDDDVIAPPGWLRAMVRPFEDPDVGVVGGKVLPRWEAAPPEWLVGFPESYLSLLNLGDEELQLSWPDVVYGCNMAIRRSVLYESGGFNPDAIGDRQLIWRRGDGETGLQKRVYENGHKVVYLPQAWIHHRIPASRLTAQAFCRRGLLVGLSMSYRHIRDTVDCRLFTSRILRRSLIAFVRAGLCYLKGVRRSNRKVRFLSDAWLWYGYAVQHLRVVFDPKLRSYLLQETHWQHVNGR